MLMVSCATDGACWLGWKGMECRDMLAACHAMDMVVVAACIAGWHEHVVHDVFLGGSTDRRAGYMVQPGNAWQAAYIMLSCQYML